VSIDIYSIVEMPEDFGIKKMEIFLIT